MKIDCHHCGEQIEVDYEPGGTHVCRHCGGKTPFPPLRRKIHVRCRCGRDQLADRTFQCACGRTIRIKPGETFGNAAAFGCFGLIAGGLVWLPLHVMADVWGWNWGGGFSALVAAALILGFGIGGFQAGASGPRWTCDVEEREGAPTSSRQENG